MDIRKETLSLGPTFYIEKSLKDCGNDVLGVKTGVFLAKSTAGNSLAKNDYQRTALNIGLRGFWSFLLQLSCLQNRHPHKNAGLRWRRDVVFYKLDVVEFLFFLCREVNLTIGCLNKTFFRSLYFCLLM